MAKKIEFTKADTVNRGEYKKGDTLSVSNSLYIKLKDNGSVKDFVEKKSKSTEGE